MVIQGSILGAFVFTAGGAVLGSFMVPVMNGIPAAWVCEYGELPEERHGSPRVKSGFVKRLLTVGFALLSGLLWSIREDWGYAAVSAVFLWLLIQAAVLDTKYLILPDQYTIGLWICGLGFLPFQESWRSPAEGALLCGGAMFLTGLLGSGQGAVGFGDVKLMAVLGFAFGLWGGAAVLCAASLLSGVSMGLLCLLGKAGGKDLLPFGPYAAAAAALWLLTGGGFRP